MILKNSTKPLILWCDAEANCKRLSTAKGAAEIVEKAKQAGIDTIIVDVLPLSGEALYRSSYAPHLSYVGDFLFPESFDLLSTMLDVGHRAGLKVCAAINVFSAGSRKWQKGPAYQHPEWQVVSYESDTENGGKAVFRRHADSLIPSWGVFTNPIGTAREHVLLIIQEIVSGYNIDGIVFDRMRYPNIHADFSDISRSAFQKWLNHSIAHWPEDIFRIENEPGQRIMQGPLYKKWLEWRAWQIRDFADDATSLVRKISPSIMAGVYVGSWYDSYYDVGVNWGSRDFHPGLSWMTPEYNRTGYAELFDFICAGCYYPSPTKEDARASGKPECASVESGCDIAKRAVGTASSVYGSIYLLDYAGRPDMFIKAVETAHGNSDGVMLFDLVYLEDYNWWPLLAKI